MIKLLIADDHPVVREGIKQIISKDPEFEIAGEALDGKEVLGKIESMNVDILVLDISMPGMDGLDVLGLIHLKKPDLPILILSMFPEEQIAVRAFKLGAQGYMNKDSAPTELVGALRKIYSGRKYVSESLAEKLAGSLGEKSDSPIDILSDREFQVLRMIASGREAKEIADDLFISVKTVRTYRDRIMEKLNLKNDVEIARFALKNNLLDS